MDWQPIESAPKDGTEIDVWEFCHDPAWRPESHGIDKGVRITNVRWEDSRWQAYDDRLGELVDVTSEHYTISHWMPLPAPPATPDPGREEGRR